MARDVCDCLEVGNNRDAVAALDEDEKGVAVIDALGGQLYGGMAGGGTCRTSGGGRYDEALPPCQALPFPQMGIPPPVGHRRKMGVYLGVRRKIYKK